MESSKTARQRIAHLARSISMGEISILEGCRQVMLERGGLAAEDIQDADLMVLVAVESELEDVPSAEGRSLWAPDSLRIVDEQANAYLSTVQAEVVRSCQSLSERWAGDA